MVNPDKITNFKLNRYQLQELLIFWICVAGKTAKTIAPRLNRFFINNHKTFGLKLWRPFDVIFMLGEEEIARQFKEYAITPNNYKARYVRSAARIGSGLDLKRCSFDELLEIDGVGMKTASCFLMHSRPGAQYAGLDTHVLKFMKALGYDVPTTTPGSKRKYKEIEKLYLEKIVPLTNRSPAALDLIVWRVYSSHRHLEPLLLRAFTKNFFCRLSC